MGDWLKDNERLDKYCRFAAAVLAGFALLLLIIAVALRGNTASPICIGGSVLLLVLSAFTFVYPTVFSMKYGSIANLPNALLEVRAQLGDLENVRREHSAARTAIETAAKELSNAQNHVLQLTKEMETTLLKHRAFFEEDVTDSRLDKTSAEQQLRQWQRCVFQVFQILEHTLELDGLPADYLKAVKKVVSDLDRTFAQLGFNLLRPEKGSIFIPNMHSMVSEESSADVPPGTVLECRNWGFRGAFETWPAKVVLAKQPGESRN